jgi:hypothetical protein
MASNIDKSRLLIAEAKALREEFRRQKRLRDIVHAHVLEGKLGAALPPTSRLTLARVAECQAAMGRLGYRVDISSSRHGIKLVCTQGEYCFVCVGFDATVVWRSVLSSAVSRAQEPPQLEPRSP